MMLRVTSCCLTLIAVLLTLMKVKCDDSSRIIIVGAGAAGIAAATKLFENNISDVIILEAENRIGGRIYTINFADSVVDLGAEYCEGEKDNIVFKLASGYNLLEPTEVDYDFYYSSRGHVNQTFLGDLYNLLNDIYENSSKQVNDSVSIGEYMTERYNENVIEKYDRNEKQLKYAKEMLDSFFTSINAYEGSFSPFNVSAKKYYKECGGNRAIIWKDKGYHTILDILMKKYPNSEDQLPIDENILTNKEVTRITWNNKNDPHNVVIECSDKSVYKGNHVIFTPSLGVLKATSQDLFDPPLPKEKVNAINKLGFGAVSKILLHFPERWWPDTFRSFIPVWAKEDKQTLLKEFPYGPVKNGKSWLLDIMGFFAGNKNNPNVLVAWAGGESIPEIEQLPDDIIIDGFTYTLNRFLDDKYSNITKPDEILHNKWYANSHFRGTYSYETVESCKEGIPLEEILLEPLVSNEKPTLLFAGEATHPTYYGTVHGAIETGHREAQRIIDLYK